MTKACMKKALVLIFVAFYALSPFSVYSAIGEDCQCSDQNSDGFRQCALAGQECPCCIMGEDMSMYFELDGPEISSCSTPTQVYAESMAPSVSEPLALMDVHFEYAYVAPLKETTYQYHSDHNLEKPPPLSS